MPPVFAHGRLRLYLLKLLEESPRHGYEVIRLLEERFHGLYAPSAGTVYPRLAKLEAEGLVTHATEGGRKVYSLTDAGREELARREGELAALEVEIRESVSELAAEIREEVRGAAGQLRSELRAAASATRGRPQADPAGREREEREEWRKVTHEWQEQARRAREDAQQARRQAKEAQEKARREVQRITRQVQEQVQDHFARGEWPTGVREGLGELTNLLGGLAKQAAPRGGARPEPEGAERTDAPEASPGSSPGASRAAEPDPEWPGQPFSTGAPARDLERLLDRFRDDIRDAARDHGVTESQLTEARRHLSTAAAHITATLITGRTRGEAKD
ncbi:helix-turn-helix transcriptional regulator [Streptomyces yaizuensis]|uniref:Helix-turn-helix transcriptional regulator n=1 Tax=Streptomyces yaizuensis TaxID=2989713 RepID=A0ABQ5NW64_9ACTN|nr:helix-turn-helix transcriptional regulator [Streptomyces sp. YSPA8]GLF94603.1 helix-turn-helix transcriptional regulator [Streptomyces sp. YSPA8]